MYKVAIESHLRKNLGQKYNVITSNCVKVAIFTQVILKTLVKSMVSKKVIKADGNVIPNFIKMLKTLETDRFLAFFASLGC